MAEENLAICVTDDLCGGWDVPEITEAELEDLREWFGDDSIGR